MKIALNGDPFEIPGPLTVSALLQQLNIDPRRVAVERNLIVVKRGAYETTRVDEGDEIEIVNVVGGGCQGYQSSVFSFQPHRRRASKRVHDRGSD